MANILRKYPHASRKPSTSQFHGLLVDFGCTVYVPVVQLVPETERLHQHVVKVRDGLDVKNGLTDIQHYIP